MRIQEYIAKLQARNALQKNDKVLVVLNDKPLVAYSNADNEEGWVDVPNLAPAKVAMTKNKPEAPVRVDIESKRLKGKVEFVVFRPPPRSGNCLMKQNLSQLLRKRYDSKTNDETDKQQQQQQPKKRYAEDDIPPELMDALDNDKDNNSVDLAEHGVYYLRGEINERSITPILTAILGRDLTGFPGEIFLFVNSSGGDAAEAWALIDLLHSTRIPVTTIGLGVIASGASMIVAAGDPGRRLVMPRTEIMVHPFHAGVFGSIHNMKATMDGMELEYERATKFWISHSVYRNKKEVEKHLMKVLDNYMTPTQAIKHGIIDGIVKDQRKIKTQALRKQYKDTKKKTKKTTAKKKIERKK